MQFVSKNINTTVLELDALPVEGEVKKLKQLVAKAPEFFAGKPILIKVALPDEEPVEAVVAAADILMDECKSHRINVVGFLVSGSKHYDSLTKRGYLCIKETGVKQRKAQGANLSGPGSSSAKTLLVRDVVRSGQRIESSGDLIVLSQVNEGAELYAAGSVHVHGVMKGRIFAGIKESDSIVYAKHAAPQLISINGVYVHSQQLKAQAHMGKELIFSYNEKEDSLEISGI